jgi:glycerol uptake facilitator-like aquaporin|tara:strand:- start:289 stop:885 length:597 start_codon:yes stop_codon:yes gene_type:complete
MFTDINWKAVSAELMGTFFLVFFGVTSFISMSGNDMLLEGTITLGLTLFILVHILGPVSGCHLNPVITLPTFISGKIKQNDTIAYIVAQISGATLGFVLFKELKPETNSSDIDILIIALVGTTFFVTSLLTSQDPASIGATLFVVTITAFGDVNPGVNLGQMFAFAIDGNAIWAFYGIIGSLIGCGLGYSLKENIIDN